MAAGSSAARAVMEKAFECPVCMELMDSRRDRHPIILSCHHSCCLSCMKEIEAKSRIRESPLSCPYCNVHVDLPSGGKGIGVHMMNFALEFAIQQYIDHIEAEEKEEEEAQRQREREIELKEKAQDEENKADSSSGVLNTNIKLCDLECGQNALLKCIQCDALFCESCDKSSHSKNAFRVHERVPINAFGRQKSMKKELCGVHNDKWLTHYCLECAECICETCVSHEHKGHYVDLIEVASSKMRAYVESKVHGIREKAKDANGLYQLQKDMRDEVRREGKKAEANIIILFERVKQVLTAKQQELCKQFMDQSNIKASTIESVMDSIKSKHGLLNTAALTLIECLKDDESHVSFLRTCTQQMPNAMSIAFSEESELDKIQQVERRGGKAAAGGGGGLRSSINVQPLIAAIESLSLCSLPEAPSGIEVVSSSLSSIEIKWNAMEDEIGGSSLQGYEVEVCDAVRNEVNRHAIGHDVTTFKASGLNPYQVYKIRVRARSAFGSGSWSPQISALSDPDKFTLDLSTQSPTLSVSSDRAAPGRRIISSSSVAEGEDNIDARITSTCIPSTALAAVVSLQLRQLPASGLLMSISLTQPSVGKSCTWLLQPNMSMETIEEKGKTSSIKGRRRLDPQLNTNDSLRVHLDFGIKTAPRVYLYINKTEMYNRSFGSAGLQVGEPTFVSLTFHEKDTVISAMLNTQ